MSSNNNGSSRSTRNRNSNSATATFSTRGFNVVDQSVNLMDIGADNRVNATGATTSLSSSSSSNAQGLTGLFRTSRETETLSRFEDHEYGDADAMNPADAEEYVEGKRRRMFFGKYLSSPLYHLHNCRQKINFRTVLTFIMACIALWLVGSSFRSFEEAEAEAELKEGSNNINNNNNNNNNNNKHNTKKRYDEIKERILDEFVSPPEFFDETKFDSPTPQQYALDWLVFEDAADLPVTHEALLDRFGLAVLYFGTNPNAVSGGTNSWKKSDHWLTEKGICLWHGVECAPREQEATEANDFEPFTKTYDANAKVTRIALAANHLRGSIPGELGTAFSELLTIDLEDNQLTGSLPSVLGKATKLRDLLLSNNQLEGTIPSVYVGLEHLHQLGLSHNRLEGPLWREEWSTSLTKLRYLAVSHNGLTGSIPDFTRMIRMTGLFLDGNLLEGSLPTSMASMTGLLDLRLSDNKLTGSIGSLRALQDLESLHLANNRFTGEIPDMFDQLFRLHVLVLAKNQFKGSIPNTLTHLQTLRTLDLDSNQLTGNLPGGLGLLTDVITISLQNNQFGGTIPTILGRLDDIKTLELNHNQLTGKIPSEVGSCFRLESLHLQHNQLTGSVPLTLGKLTRLSSMHLEANDFRDIDMPGEICALTEEDDLSILVSDCSEAVRCSCCTECL